MIDDESNLVPAPPYPAVGRFSAEDVNSIVDRLFQGESQSRIARSLNCEQYTISRLVHSLGIQDALVGHLRMANAHEAMMVFNRRRQLRTIAEVADELDATIDRQRGTFEAKELRDLAVTAGILVDKQRLEDGESTANQSVQVRRVWSDKALPPPDV